MSILDKILFEDPNASTGIVKATIHKTGKLGFSAAAQGYLELGENSYFKVGFDPESDDLYLVPVSDGEGAFKVAKAGDYYYINLKYVFDKKGYEYHNKTMIYDIKKQTSEGISYYILKRRK